jgi:hypothetical protein
MTRPMKKIPPHPSRPMAFALMGIGGVLGGVAAFSGVASAGVFGAVAVLTGVFQWRMGTAAQNANAAAAAINRGDMNEARELVAFVRGRHRLTYVHRLLDSHESEIAWREGDLVLAKKHLETARARRDLVPYGAWREIHVAHIESLYALVLAMLGEDAGAEAVIARVRANERASGSSLARAELAHAALLARRSDLNALHHHLMRHHVLLAEGLESRGRALHRAFRRLTATRGSNAYRMPVRSGTPKASGTATWLSRVFPAGAELIDLDEGSEVGRAIEAPVAATEPAALPKQPRKSATKRVLVVWVLLILLFVATFGLRTPIEPGDPMMPGISVGTIFTAFIAVLFVAVLVVMRRARAKVRALEEAQRAFVCGEHERARSIVQELVGDKNGVIAASARLILANLRERESDFAGALTDVDHGLSLMTGTVRMGSADVLHPQLVATRAFLFGALGRDGDSDAELARLAREFPAFPYAAGTVLRTRLMRAIRSGDTERARELARARGDVSLGGFGELAADIVLARDAEDRDERLAAIREDLAALPAAERWLKLLGASAEQLPAAREHA